MSATFRDPWSPYRPILKKDGFFVRRCGVLGKRRHSGPLLISLAPSGRVGTVICEACARRQGVLPKWASVSPRFTRKAAQR